MTGRYCVLIPAFDAAKTIGGLVSGIKTQGLPVVVVDDGSRDRTAELASKQGAVVISHLRNQGKGAALRTGFEYALRSQYDGVVTMDGDGQHDPGDIPQLLRAGEVQHAGIVLGNRMMNGAVMPPARRWTNRFMSAVISRLVRQHIPDSQCGFRFVHTKVLGTVRLYGKRFEIETELLLAASAGRWKIVSVPVRSIYQQERSHIRPVRDALRFFGVLIRYALRPPARP
jgi:glycosyltransferase involved in cell wall biosynthesis